jgi:hypothetical protein
MNRRTINCLCIQIRLKAEAVNKMGGFLPSAASPVDVNR